MAVQQEICVSPNNIIAIGSEGQKQNYMATMEASTAAAISLHLQDAPNNPQAARVALTTLLQRKGRILDALSNSQRLLRQNLTPENQSLFDELEATRAQLAALLYNKSSNVKGDAYRQEVAKLNTKAENLEAELAKRGVICCDRQITRKVAHNPLS